MLFSGMVKTMESDGMMRRWSVAFHALSWDDAESLGQYFGVSEICVLLGTFDAITGHAEELVPHFCAWHFRNGKFIDEENVI